jgi:hypothetical protein
MTKALQGQQLCGAFCWIDAQTLFRRVCLPDVTKAELQKETAQIKAPIDDIGTLKTQSVKK